MCALFEAEQQRTRDLSEALEQQTATSDVLKVISRSPGDLAPVFETMLANAVRICEAKFGDLWFYDGDAFRLVATHGAPPGYVEACTRDPMLRPPPDSPLGRVAITRQVVHIPDIKTIPSYIEGHPFVATSVELAGYRTVLAVPMLKENEFIGAIVFPRQEVRPFTDKQIELVQNFAAQAVIAIENARLLNELRQRTDDLSEALEQQTATSDVLQVISSSPGELEPVFETMLAKATELCGASYGTLWLREGDAFRPSALHGALPAAWIEQWRSGTLYRPGPGRPIARMIEARGPIQVADMTTDVSYLERDPAGRRGRSRRRSHPARRSNDQG
jgi:transcriptional regulator with GAF, ATPase, and Fis domain